MILTKSHTNRSCGGASSATCCLNPRTARAGWPLPNASSKLGLPRACPQPRPRPRTRRHGHHRALRCPVLDDAAQYNKHCYGMGWVHLLRAHRSYVTIQNAFFA